MRKMRKRAMSFVVSVSLVVGLVPLPSMAATPESKEEDTSVVSAAAEEETDPKEDVLISGSDAAAKEVQETGSGRGQDAPATDAADDGEADVAAEEEAGTEDDKEADAADDQEADAADDQEADAADHQEADVADEKAVEANDTQGAYTVETPEQAVADTQESGQKDVQQADGEQSVPRLGLVHQADVLGGTGSDETPEPVVMQEDTSYGVTINAGSYWVGSFTATSTGYYEFFSLGSDDTLAELYTDQALTQQVASDDDSGEDSNFLIRHYLSASTTVYLKVEGYDEDNDISTTITARAADLKDLSKYWSGSFRPDSLFEEGTTKLSSPYISMTISGTTQVLKEGQDFKLVDILDDKGESIGTTMPVSLGAYKAVYEGIDPYHGKKEIGFRVTGAYDIKSGFWYGSFVGGNEVLYYGGNFVRPRLVLMHRDGQRQLTEGEDFKFTGYRDGDNKEITNPTNGYYSACYKGIGAYKGEYEEYLYVRNIKFLSNYDLEVMNQSIHYTGKAVTLITTVTDDKGNTLEQNKDYELVYLDHNGTELAGPPAEKGTYKVYAKAKAGSGYEGSTSDTEFRIIEPWPQMTAVRMNLNSANSVRLEGDERWLGVFTAPRDGGYIFASEGEDDTYAELYLDADLTQMVRSNDDSEYDLNFSIRYELKANQTVYLMARPYSNGGAEFKASVKEVTEKDLSLANYVYDTGLEKKIRVGDFYLPKLIIKSITGKELVEGVDYTIQYYKINDETGKLELITAFKEMGHYVFKATAKSGSGYTGELRGDTFAINANSLLFGKITGTKKMFAVGESIANSFTVYNDAGTKLKEGTDYRLQYYKKDGDSSSTLSDVPTEIGDYTVVAKSLDNKNSEQTQPYEFFIRDTKDIITSATITLSNPAYMEGDIPVYIYGGSAVRPQVIIKDLNGTVISSGYYDVTYENNTGTIRNGRLAKATITAKSPYKGTYVQCFKIVAKVDLATMIENNGFNVMIGKEKAEYSAGLSTITSDVYQWGTDVKFVLTTKGSVVLTQGTDYTIAYTDKNGNALAGVPAAPGRYGIIIKATAAGKCTGEYRIGLVLTSGQSDAYFDMTKAVVTLGATRYYYDGKVKAPGVKSVTYNGIPLTAGKDYEVVAPANCKNVGTYTYIIYGKGHFLGSLKASFAIVYKGWQKIGSKWYYYTAEGKKTTGWVKDGKKWYFMDKKSGAMKTGWVKDGRKWYFMDKKSGAMKTGWVKDGRKWYFLKSDGSMAYSEWCKGYWLNKDGTCTYAGKASWVKDKTGWTYRDDKGWMAKSASYTIDGKRYIFDANGYLK